MSFGPFLLCKWQTEQTPNWLPLFDVRDSGLESSLIRASCLSIVDLFKDPAGLPLFFGTLLSEGSNTFLALYNDKIESKYET